jgi:hypothetical protein
MATLISLTELATWARKDPAVVGADPFATLVVNTASNIVTDKAQQPNWEIQSPAVEVPRAAKRICMFLAGRTYLNPDGEIATNVGPLGARVPEAMAMAAANMQLLAAEIDELLDLRPSGSGGLWVQPTERGDAVLGTDVYIPDDSGSDWWIPMGDDYSSVAFTPLEP